jgi:hypothetical protein
MDESTAAILDLLARNERQKFLLTGQMQGTFTAVCINKTSNFYAITFKPETKNMYKMTIYFNSTNTAPSNISKDKVDSMLNKIGTIIDDLRE